MGAVWSRTDGVLRLMPPSAGDAPPMRRVYVWDLPTRLFHWVLVAAVLVALFTGFVPNPAIVTNPQTREAMLDAWSEGAPIPFGLSHVVDSDTQRAGHVDVPTAAGDAKAVLRAFADHSGPRRDHDGWNHAAHAAAIDGEDANSHPAPIIFSGFTIASKSVAEMRPEAKASSRSVVPFLCAALAIFAALS